MTTSTETRLIADRFAEVLRSWLTPDEFAEMKRLNETPEYADGCCASHNYCDANMAMDEAWHAIKGSAINADDETQAALWNQSWELARALHLGCAR